MLSYHLCFYQKKLKKYHRKISCKNIPNHPKECNIYAKACTLNAKACTLSAKIPN